MKKIYIIPLLLCFCLSVSAQQKLDKVSQSINVNDNVKIDLNTSYTNIEIDTWNKDIIEVEAYIESSVLSKEELQKHLENWKIDVDASKDRVIISSDLGGLSWSDNSSLFELQSLDALQDLEVELANIPVMPMVEGLLESMDLANMPKMPKMPKMPDLPDLPDGMSNINFDYERYQEEGEAYMEKWSREYGDKYGEAYAKKMEKWAKEVDSEALAKYEKDMEAWGEKFGEKFGAKFEKDMEKWGDEFGEKFGKSMEKWGEEFGEEFGKSMEKWGEEFGKQMEEQAKVWEEQAKVWEEQAGILEERSKENEEAYRALFESRSSKNLNIKKVIKIKIPKKAKLNLNVRHGELKVSSLINNVKADLNHATFLANSIDGEKTSINASYGSVLIKSWELGTLKLNFVENAILQDVNGLVLNSNSSNIGIDRLAGNAILTGSFGDLVIHNISEDFNNINITLDNSNAAVKLPKVDFNLQYQGKNSRLHHPKNKNDNAVSSFKLGSLNSNKTIAINARYSKVVME
ncbi:YggN family protein [Hanstruepera ponticola]|uniref:YggN family protein n=1 Tax=Hanstruepera ponticola TaxID=2042995 RepID=UPI0013C47D88|nr:YggN family protein [Hanstruepera ponticola]